MKNQTEELQQRKQGVANLVILIAVPTAWLFYFTSKVLKFRYQEYLSDLFSHLQMARGWLQGRPLLFENCYGHHGKIHNYYFDVLMGPFALWWGAYGIFIFQLALYLLAFFYSNNILRKKDLSPYRINSLLFYIVIFSGPLAYYVYDNPHYGFHAEMMYVPLALLFASTLYARNRFVSVMAGIAIVLVKEDGAVVGACIHLLFGLYNWQRGGIGRKEFLRYALPRMIMWLLAFAAGILLLKFRNLASGSRLDVALQAFSGQPWPELKDYFSGILLQFILLFSPLLVCLLWFRKLKFLAAFLLLLLPLLIVNLLSAFPYYPATFFSLSWTPRFAVVMAYALAAIFFMVASANPTAAKNIRINVLLTTIAGLLLFWLQWYQLKGQVQYNWREEAIGIYAKEDPAETIPRYAQMKKLSEVLPRDYPIAPPFEHFGYFHKADHSWINFFYNAYREPRMIVCTEGTRQFLNLELLQEPDSLITGELRIYFEKADRTYLEQAGIYE